MTPDLDELRRRGAAFRQLHLAGELFVMPNPWDAGSARILAGLGFPALATTSAGLAHSLGRPDGANRVGRDEATANARAIVEATPLPVSADLEHCYGGPAGTPAAESAAAIAATIAAAAGAGLSGGSIEDATGDPAAPVLPLAEAQERVAAAAAAAASLAFPFTLTARAENFLHGRPDLADTIARLRAYEEAGADVLYAPGLPDLDAVRAVCAAVGRPVNVLARPEHTLDGLRACGVRRVSLGSGLSRAALGALRRAAQEILGGGTFAFAADAYPYGELNTLMAGGGDA